MWLTCGRITHCSEPVDKPVVIDWQVPFVEFTSVQMFPGVCYSSSPLEETQNKASPTDSRNDDSFFLCAEKTHLSFFFPYSRLWWDDRTRSGCFFLPLFFWHRVNTAASRDRVSILGAGREREAAEQRHRPAERRPQRQLRGVVLVFFLSANKTTL